MIKKITEYLNSVREEVILYTGLNYNIDEIGSLKRDLTLYLDMEVLFDIYGYSRDIGLYGFPRKPRYLYNFFKRFSFFI